MQGNFKTNNISEHQYYNSPNSGLKCVNLYSFEECMRFKEVISLSGAYSSSLQSSASSAEEALILKPYCKFCLFFGWDLLNSRLADVEMLQLLPDSTKVFKKI